MAFYEIESALTYTFTSGESAIFSSGGIASKCKISKGAAVSIGLYGAASGTSVFNGGTMSFLSGCFAGETNVVQSGGVLLIDSCANVKSTVADNGAVLRLAMTGNYFTARPMTTFNITSGGVAIKNTDNTSGYTGWNMKTSGCTLEIFDYASAAFVKVSNGCSLLIGRDAPYGAGAAGTVDVYDGGYADLYKAKGVGLATIHSGGVMFLGDYSEDTTVMENGGYLSAYSDRVFQADEYFDPNVKIKPNTFKDLVLKEWTSATAHSGTVASHTTLKESSVLEVYSGGLAANTVISGGWLKVFSGGVASDISFETSNSWLDVVSGGKITGKLDFGNGSVIVGNGAIIDFDISALKGNNTALLTNYNVMPVNVGDPRHTITVSGMTQTKGTYALATQAYSLRADSEYRSEQQKIFAICDTSGTKIGSVKIGTKALVGDRTYALSLSGSGDLSLTVAAYVEGEEIWSDSGNDADDGWNNDLFVPKVKVVLPEFDGKLKSTPVLSTPATTPVVLDEKLSITVNKKVYKNYAGAGDGADFAKFTLDKSARLNFSVNATGSAKFTVWKVVPFEDGEFKVKSVKSVSTKKSSKKAVEYTASTGQLLLESGVYYVSVEASTKKSSRAYYNVEIDQKEFYLKSNNADDWGDVKENGSAGKVDNTTIKTLKAGTSKVLSGGWVGCGDAVDYMKFHLDTAAKLVFQVNAGDVSKFEVYSLNGPKKGKYSLKSLLSAALSKNRQYGEEGEPAYLKTTKPVLLESGDYYVCVKSSNAKKDGDADYDILLDASSIFYDKIDNGRNNVLLEKKKLVGVCETISLGLASKSLQMDKDPVNFEKWKNFVGHNDPADYAKIALSQDVNACFTIEAKDAAKFTVYKLVGKTDGKYSLKAITSKTLKKGSDGIYAATVKSKLKKDDVLYICMKSTNAKKGGNAYYNVTYAPVTQDKDAFSGPEEDANAWGVVESAPGDPVWTTNGSALSVPGIATLSGADLADLQMSAAVDPAASPAPVESADDLFTGLLSDGNAFAEVSAPAAFSQNEALLRQAAVSLA